MNTERITTERITVRYWQGNGFTVIQHLSNGEQMAYSRSAVNPHDAAVQILRLGVDLPRTYESGWTGETLEVNSGLEGILARSRDTFCSKCASLSGIHDRRCPAGKK